ncbi:MAG: alpha/beta hydrolase [Acidobacteria bacterium]|nr:alpha/beta hydrolase [Acidobacteriota bacterium]
MRLVRIGITLGALFLGFLALVWVFQRHLIYIPSGEILPPSPGFPAGLEEVSLETEDGLRLGAWFIPPAGKLPVPAVLVLNGNAGNRSYRSLLAEALSRAGLAVLLFDYRGYGGNPGSPSETGLSLDARAARRYLAGRPDVDASRMVYFGESLGAAVALALAEKYPPAALVLRSPFTSMVDIGRLHYPFLPVRLLLKDHYPSLERIARIRCPILILAGDRDRIIPIRQSRKLFEAAQEPKRFSVIPGADHNDWDLLAGDLLLQDLLDFLEASIGPWTSEGPQPGKEPRDPGNAAGGPPKGNDPGKAHSNPR